MLVSIDGSEQFYKALNHAVAIAERYGSELTLFTIVLKVIVPELKIEELLNIILEEEQHCSRSGEGLGLVSEHVDQAEYKVRSNTLN